MIGKNMELMLPQLEKYLFPQPNTGSVNIAQTQTEAKTMQLLQKTAALKVSSAFISLILNY